MRLVDRRPRLTADDLVARFVPPHRFEAVRFDNYRPDPDFPSQSKSRERLVHFAETVAAPAAKKGFRLFRRPEVLCKPALYLDGGYGVGKTHLLASLWHATSEPKSYATFAEITAFIGFVGMGGAIKAFQDTRLLCMDEFELDDVANTLMVVSFLRGVMANGLRLAVTSNTLPDQLGEQRFSASEFRREIAAISAYFEELRIDGSDFRTSTQAKDRSPLFTATQGVKTVDDFDELLAHLRTLHPVQYGALFDGISQVTINGLHPINDQDQALLWVNFVDKLYDARVSAEISGCDFVDLFAPDYRSGGYRKKYGRALSRLEAMGGESVA